MVLRFIRHNLPPEKVSATLNTSENVMPVPSEIIRDLLESHFTGAEIHLEDLAGDEDHFALQIISDKFEGKSRVARHQMIYKALGGKMGGELHALSIKALTPHESKIS